MYMYTLLPFPSYPNYCFYLNCYGRAFEFECCKLSPQCVKGLAICMEWSEEQYSCMKGLICNLYSRLSVLVCTYYGHSVLACMHTTCTCTVMCLYVVHIFIPNEYINRVNTFFSQLLLTPITAR